MFVCSVLLVWFTGYGLLGLVLSVCFAVILVVGLLVFRGLTDMVLRCGWVSDFVVIVV